VVLAILVFATGVLTSPGPTRAADANTLVIATSLEPTSIDPAQHDGWYSVRVQAAVYESLIDMRYDGKELNLEPGLATSWTVSPDGKVYTFRLREGVRFHDRTPFNAEAVKVSIERNKKIGGRASYQVAPIKSIETPDRLTVRIELAEPWAGFLHAMARAYVISPTQVQVREEGSDLSRRWLHVNANGTGPYMLREPWVKGQPITLVRNPDYWRGWTGSHLERIILRYVPETTTQRLLIERGDVDIADTVSVDSLDALRKIDSLKVEVNPSPAYLRLIMRNHEGPLADRRARQAMSYAFDYDGMISKIMKGAARRWYGPLPEGWLGHAKDARRYTYDPAKARQLFQEAGLLDRGVRLRYIYIGAVPYQRDAGILLQAALRQFGIELELAEQPSGATLMALMYNPDAPVQLIANIVTPFIPDPDQFRLRYHSSGVGGLNGSIYRNPRVDALLEEAARSTRERERARLYSESHKILAEDAVDIWVMAVDDVKVFRKVIKGWVTNPYDSIQEYRYYDMYKTAP
jgi:peptide/nickel transport system substrate-binding protein